MAAIHTERGREIVKLASEDIRFLSFSLKLRPDGMIKWLSADGRSGIAGIFSETDDRAVAAQTRYAKSSMTTIGRTHKLQTLTSDSMSKIGRDLGPSPSQG